ncbi:MAG TPA: hypothetical protein VES88_16475 [Gemmatimonadaceae bacterium]|nr:hypothetical protein [Gemmatimonadaceae bacterium]
MCCGSNRAAARAAAIAASAGTKASVGAAAASATSVIMFEYVGTGEAAIRGPVSDQVYRFGGPGDRLRVDPRDRPGLAALASLRWVR